MSSFEWNKIIASVLTAMIVAMVAGVLASQLVSPHRLHEAVYLPPGAEGGAPAAGPPHRRRCRRADRAAAGQAPTPRTGQQLAKVCTQCHTFEKGGANKIGPNLYGVTEENIAAMPGYQFSPALSAKKDEKWTPENLNVWLHNPQSFAKGTKMTFAGHSEAQDRADVIAYLEFAEIGLGIAGPGARKAGRKLIDLDPFITLATDLADAAGAAIRPLFPPAIAVDDKPDLSPVTVADREAEAAMRRLIAARFPDHGIIGEEFGRERDDAEFVWVLDPIDGTKSFISGRAAVRDIDRAGATRAPDPRHHRPADLARALGRRRRPADAVQRRRRPRSALPALAAATLFATSPDMFSGSDKAALRPGRRRRQARAVRRRLLCLRPAGARVHRPRY